MKNIVYSCKTITQDIDSFEEELAARSPTSPGKNMPLLKNDMSQALTYLMGLAKQFAVDPDEVVKGSIEEAMAALTSVILDIYTNTESLLKSIESNDNLSIQPHPTDIVPGSSESLSDVKVFYLNFLSN